MNAELGGQMRLVPGIRIVTMSVIGEPVKGPNGIVYSTEPRSAFDDAGVEYVIKGPEPEVVVAESVAHLLATKLSIEVPNFVLASVPGTEGLFFASQKLDAMRDVEPFLQDLDPALREDLARIVLLDLWVANRDRNIGNLLVQSRSDAPGFVPIAIDFEKSIALRDRHPIINSSLISLANIWPSGPLGECMADTEMPTNLEAVESLDSSFLEEIVSTVATVLPTYDWSDATASALRHRQGKLREFAEEVWQ